MIYGLQNPYEPYKTEINYSKNQLVEVTGRTEKILSNRIITRLQKTLIERIVYHILDFLAHVFLTLKTQAEVHKINKICEDLFAKLSIIKKDRETSQGHGYNTINSHLNSEIEHINELLTKEIQLQDKIKGGFTSDKAIAEKKVQLIQKWLHKFNNLKSEDSQNTKHTIDLLQRKEAHLSELLEHIYIQKNYGDEDKFENAVNAFFNQLHSFNQTASAILYSTFLHKEVEQTFEQLTNLYLDLKSNLYLNELNSEKQIQAFTIIDQYLHKIKEFYSAYITQNMYKNG
ncbi:hypothetical protein BN1013_02305 [Candidatus Rubidus massiliensis]|nr:MAG: hypothetical protein BGO10_05945 [Chlamydia sp. 32-24]CDZ81769.1 hypothetical protein BN1013_02305 [Candidatus Rubidus massiliensis]